MNHQSDILRAASFAAKKHTGHYRKGSNNEPYINHPLEVANLLANVGKVDDTDILIAALLHDTVEDTDTTNGDIKEMFGERVASIVAEVTDDKSLPKKERKRLQVEHAPTLSKEAKTLKLADKISNITDIMHSPPAKWDKKRRRKYIDWGEEVVQGLRGTNELLETEFDRIAKIARESIVD